MIRTEDLQDALVDTYRALQAINRAGREAAAVPVLSLVPGTGRSCKPNRFVPSKRIKALHRSHRVQRVDGSIVTLSLKAYARMLAADSGVRRDIAERWLAGKGVRQ